MCLLINLSFFFFFFLLNLLPFLFLLLDYSYLKVMDKKRHEEQYKGIYNKCHVVELRLSIRKTHKSIGKDISNG